MKPFEAYYDLGRRGEFEEKLKHFKIQYLHVDCYRLAELYRMEGELTECLHWRALDRERKSDCWHNSLVSVLISAIPRRLTYQQRTCQGQPDREFSAPARWLLFVADASRGDTSVDETATCEKSDALSWVKLATLLIGMDCLTGTFWCSYRAAEDHWHRCPYRALSARCGDGEYERIRPGSHTLPAILEMPKPPKKEHRM